MVTSSRSDGDSYCGDRGIKEQESLCVAHNSVSAVDDTLVEEGVEKKRRTRVYHTHGVVCLA